MTGRKSYEPQKCIPVINDVQDEKFAEETEDEALEDCSGLPRIWKNPERLSIPSDYSMLLSSLSREIQVESNYSETLLVLKTMKNRKNSPEIDKTIDKMFEFLLTQILREEIRRKVDSHIILEWLDTGDRRFSSENISKKAYAILKLYFLCRSRKAKLECFPCGCVQKIFIELYTENSNTRLIGALNSLITGKLADLDPVVKRLFHQMPQIRPIEYYEYYIELLGELQMCSVIDKTDEKQLPRVIQLIGLLSELKLEDVPKACGKLYNLMGTMKGEGGKKKSSVIDNAVRSKLLPKIFDSIILSAGNSKILNLSRNSIPKMVELVANEKYLYAEQATVLFAPLQFLNRIFQEFEIWEKSWAALKNRLDSFKMSNPQAPIVFLYFLSFIYKNDQSLIGCLVEFLELQYHQNSGNSEIKKTILILLEIMERLGDSAPSINQYFKENHPKNRLLLDESEELEIVLEHFQDFSNAEINQFLAKKSFSASEFSILVDKLKDDSNFSITSDGFWKILLEKIDENSMIFIENQLKCLVNRQDRKSIQTKIEQIFRKILKNFEEKSTKKLELVLLKFPKILLDFNDEQWRLLPPTTTTISLVSTLIFGFSAVFEGNESQITALLQQLLSKITVSPAISNSKPMEILEEIIERISKNRFSGSLEIGFLKEIYDEKPENLVKKERILQISAVIFEKLAAELQKSGDTNGKAPFCQISTIIDDYLKKIGRRENEIIQNFEILQQISLKTMRGYVLMWTEKWNWLFVSRKIWTILSTAKTMDLEFLKELMGILNQNQTLLFKLRSTNKEFVQLEQSL
ncbi:hypothetical protein B9Z55_000463 [Caenorhabditis nigoni]|uniref:Uncharacterized protein n=1 Tax=Caenorhabditis nigoni TaxID=1611254 RepID=A0A2G5VTP0_9PELO|nr:hypothetical protein B9Z55_000463 [Caenorhabditis nigoni]